MPSTEAAREWWERVRTTAPIGLHGLWFGLVELADGGWHMHVAGTDEFDPDDETAEWAVGPYALWPDERYLELSEVEHLDVGAAVEHAASVVRSCSPWHHIDVDGVAVGFDDGDFAIIYVRQSGH